MKEITYCINCGKRHLEKTFPKKCSSCNHEMYLNPTPVAILVVRTNNGVLLVRRNIPPQKDLWAFPGGFINNNESPQEAAIRELKEETGLSYLGELEFINLYSSSNKILIFLITKDILNIPSNYVFKQNIEVSEIKFVSKEEQLAFPTHSEILKKVLSKN